MRKRWIVLGITMLLSLFILAGCKTTAKDIDKWAGGVGGEKLIADAMANPKLDPPVRVHAMITLIKIKQSEMMLEKLKKLPDQERMLLIKESAPEIGKLFQTPGLEIQAAAKDALYSFMNLGDKSLQESSAQAILVWYSTNFPTKYSAGRNSAFNVLSEMGPKAGDLLISLMEKEKSMRIKVARIVEKINDPELIRKTSDLLITMFNQQVPNPESDLLQVLCFVRDDRLTELLNRFVADKKIPAQKRSEVFNTLTYKTSKLTIPVATSIFIDKKEDIDLRGIAIEILEQIGDASLLKYLYPFLREEDVKWAVFAAILKLGGANEVENVFNKLDTKVTFWDGDYKVARRHLRKLDASAAPKLLGYLKSKEVPLVALALLGLQYTADKDMAEKEIKALAGDKREIKNYTQDKPTTIGMLAEEVYSKIVSGAGKTEHEQALQQDAAKKNGPAE